MKKWEYLSLSLGLADYVKGMVNKEFTPELLDEELNEYRNAGWEMVGIGMPNGAHSSIIIFKKEL